MTIEDTLTRIVRQADAEHEREGGNSRHWVRDRLLPLLAESGLAIVRVADSDPPTLAAVEAAVSRMTSIADVARVRCAVEQREREIPISVRREPAPPAGSEDARRIRAPQGGDVIVVGAGPLGNVVTPGVVTRTVGLATIVSLCAPGSPTWPPQDPSADLWGGWGEERPGLPAYGCWCWPAASRGEIDTPVIRRGYETRQEPATVHPPEAAGYTTPRLYDPRRCGEEVSAWARLVDVGLLP